MKRRSRVPGTYTAPPPSTPPRCSTCDAHRERLETMKRRGEGTPAELRAAIDLLENADPPLGETVRVRWEGTTVYACPRHTELVLARGTRGQRRRVRK